MNRCSATLFVTRHDVGWRVRRDAAGVAVKPHTLDWYCRRCDKALGDTSKSVQPSWSLLARLRRQAPWAREKSRMAS